MAALTLITRTGDVKYFICDTYANLASQKPNWTGALCRVDDGTWYEWRQFNDDLGNGAWETYSGPPISLSISTGAITESNPLPIKTSLLSAVPSIVYNAISATPATPYTIVLEGTNVKEIKLITSGTSTSRTMTFKAKLNSDDTFKPFLGVNLSNATDTLATQTTGKDEIWLFSGLDGIHSLEFNVTAVAGGTFTVKAESLS